MNFKYQVIKYVNLIFENCFTNPLKLVLYNFYYILYILNISSIVELFFNVFMVAY